MTYVQRRTTSWPVRLQLVCESIGLVVRGALHAHFPGGEAAGHELLLDVRLVGLRVPAVVLVEPVLEDDLCRRDARLFELRFDNRARLLGIGSRGCVDEDRVSVVRHGQAVERQLLRQLLRARADVDAQPLEEATGLLLVELDADAPVVAGHRRQPSLRRGPL